MSEQTFKVQSPHIKGDAVRFWQQTLLNQMHTWGWKKVPLKVDGDYGVTTRAYTALVLKGLGIAQAEMAHGVTPEVRIKVRNKRLTETERKRYNRRRPWRIAQRVKYSPRKVRSPIRPANIEQDSWGWHPGIHDGIDLITPEGTVLYSIIRSKVVRADKDGWWALGAPADAKLRARGDGIIILEALQNSGPIKKGMHLAYGHAEHPRVKAGDIVDAGDPIGRAGLANAGHVHFMVNNGTHFLDNGKPKGIGDRDPGPIYRYARRRG